MDSVNNSEKYLSIITNFGCHYQCPYCIVRENGLKMPATTIYELWELEEAIKKTGATIVSISGGGDPLYNYDKNKTYYSVLFAICERLNIPVELHTSYVESNFPYHKCSRIVYHLRDKNSHMKVRRHGKETVRIVYVVQKWMNPIFFNRISRFVKSSKDIDELSYRQLVDSKYKEIRHWHKYLLKHHKHRWWYIEQNDYNLYYAGGIVYDSYKSIFEN